MSDEQKKHEIETPDDKELNTPQAFEENRQRALRLLMAKDLKGFVLFVWNTSGDSLMGTSLPEPYTEHALEVVDMARELKKSAIKWDNKKIWRPDGTVN